MYLSTYAFIDTLRHIFADKHRHFSFRLIFILWTLTRVCVIISNDNAENIEIMELLWKTSEGRRNIGNRMYEKCFIFAEWTSASPNCIFSQRFTILGNVKYPHRSCPALKPVRRVFSPLRELREDLFYPPPLLSPAPSFFRTLVLRHDRIPDGSGLCFILIP